jgi:hypothetical protein
MVVQSTHTLDNESGKAPAVLMPLGAEGSLLMETSRRWSAGAIATAILAAIGILVLLLWGMQGPVSTNKENGAAAQLHAPSPSPSPKDKSVCSNSWPMVTSDHLKNRWFAEGMASISDAETNADAVAAAPDFSERVSQDPVLLVGAAKGLHVQDNVDIATLTDSKGCATDATVKLKIGLDVAIATAHSITLGEAPANGTNTGVENGKVVSDVGGTISGNRKAIQIVLSDGTTIWIMARCGNIVTSGPPIFPPGKTDNPPCQETGTCVPVVCPPNLPHGTPATGCKDTPAQAPNHSGGNGTSYSPTPTTPSPTPTQPPSTPRANPPVQTTPITPAPVITPQPSNPAAPPVDTGGQSNNGNIPPTGTGGACNPEFQSC